MLFPNAIRNKSQHKKKHPKKEATESRLSGSGKFIVFTLQSAHTQPGTSIILVLKKSGQIERHIPMPFTFFSVSEITPFDVGAMHGMQTSRHTIHTRQPSTNRWRNSIFLKYKIYMHSLAVAAHC